MRRLLTSLVAILGLSAGTTTLVQAQNYHRVAKQTPDVYVVMFRADWCAPCKIVEPRLANALNSIRDPRIEYVKIDLPAGHGDWNAHTVFDRGIVQQYNDWLGITGFAAIIDGDTKRTLGCVNMNYDTGAMTNHIRNLQNKAKRNSHSFDMTCPKPNNRV